jgi:hypothetical protein
MDDRAEPRTLDAVLDHVLVWTAAGLVAAWGVSHLVPTKQVVAGFGEISADNRRILTMEWIAEGLAMLFVGALVATVTLVGDPGDGVSVSVYRAAAGLLAAIAVLTTLTAARTPVIWFKACPVVMSVGIGLLLAGSLV